MVLPELPTAPDCTVPGVWDARIFGAPTAAVCELPPSRARQVRALLLPPPPPSPLPAVSLSLSVSLSYAHAHTPPPPFPAGVRMGWCQGSALQKTRTLGRKSAANCVQVSAERATERQRDRQTEERQRGGEPTRIRHTVTVQWQQREQRLVLLERRGGWRCASTNLATGTAPSVTLLPAGSDSWCQCAQNLREDGWTALASQVASLSCQKHCGCWVEFHSSARDWLLSTHCRCSAAR